MPKKDLLWIVVGITVLLLLSAMIENKAHAATYDDTKLPTSTAQLLVVKAAEKYNLDILAFYYTLDCESGFNSNEQTGDSGTSIGIAQIHLPVHTEISRTQALDGAWSINWAAQMFAAGHASWWSCWNQYEQLSTTTP